jgi:type IV pilus assembly protein PilB
MLGELLLRAGVITEAQLRTALAEQKKWGGKLGYLLVEMNFLDEDTLVKALSKQLNLPRIEFKGLDIPKQVLARVEAEYAEERQVLPISYDAEKNILLVATADPADLSMVDELGFRTGCHIKTALSGERALARAIRKHYFADDAAIGSYEGQGAQPMKVVDSSGDTIVKDLRSAERPEPAAKKSHPAVTPVSQLEGSFKPEVPDAADAPDSLEAKLGRLESVQKKQIHLMKVVVELLMEKGYISPEEYRRKVEQ